MANEYLLSEYADEAALQKQTAFILQSFEQIEAKAKAVGISVKTAFESLGDPSGGSKKLIEDFSKLEKGVNDFSKATQVNTAALKQQNVEMIASSKAMQEVNVSLEKNIETRRKLQNSLNSYVASQKEDLALMKTGTITRDEYNKRVVESQVKIEQYKNKINDLNKAIKEQTSTTQTLTKEQKLQNALYETERNSLGRAQAMILLYTAEKKKLNLATADGIRMNENYNKAIAASNAFILKNADAETVRAKSVGKYTEGIQKAFSGLRTLANIIPGIGISGLFLLGYEAITKAIGALGIFNSRLSDAKRQTQLLADVNESFANNAGQEVAKLEVLYKVATNVNLSIKERKKAVDELQEQYPEYFKNINDEVILQGKAKDAYDAAKIAILEKAKAQAIEGELAKLATKELKIQQAQQESINKKNEAAAKAREIDKRKATTKDQKEDKGIDQFLIIGKIGTFNKEISDANKDLAEIAKDRDFLLSKLTVASTTDKDGKGGGKESFQLQALKDRLNTEFEIYKIAQERKLKILQDDLASDKIHYYDKLIVLKNFVEASQELIDRQEQEDIANKKRAAEREIQRLNEEKKGKSPEQIKRLNENIKIVEENLQEDLLLIQAQAADKSVELSRNAQKAKIKLTEDYLKAEKELYDEYNKNQAAVDKATDDRIKKGFERRLKAEEEAARKKVELEKDLQNKKIQLAEQAEQFLFKLGEASYTRQLNALRDLQDAQEAKAAREIEIVNASAANEQDKAAQIQIINAKLQTQKEQNEKKAREIEVQKAKFQRAQQIFEIGIGAIKAIAAIKAQAAILLANPLTAVLAPIALAQIPIVLGGAALSIAGVLATPIPRFKDGKPKGNKYSGAAIVNDGSKLEVIERADGTIEFPEERNALAFVGANDIVHPDREAFLDSLKHSAIKDTARAANGKISEAGYAIAMTQVLGNKLDTLNGNVKKLVNKEPAHIDMAFYNDDYFRIKTNW